MFELTRLPGGEYYVRCPAQFGVIPTGDNEVCLIDSGTGESAGRQILSLLEQKNWKLRAIYNSHGHADHTGGNRWLQEHTGCVVYANGAEQIFASRPILDPAFLYGGDPPEEICTEMLMPQASRVHPLTEEALPDGWSVIPLPGHTYDMVGYRTPGDAVFLADCLSGKDTLEVHKITFLTDVEACLQTLRTVGGMSARTFVPAHAPACDDISGLAEFNERHILRLAETIYDLCGEPAPAEEVLKGLFDRLDLTLGFFEYALAGSTVRSFLTWLKNNGRAEAFFEGNRLLWRAV